jgi:hypothetical protein
MPRSATGAGARRSLPAPENQQHDDDDDDQEHDSSAYVHAGTSLVRGCDHDGMDLLTALERVAWYGQCDTEQLRGGVCGAPLDIVIRDRSDGRESVWLYCPTCFNRSGGGWIRPWCKRLKPASR